MSIVVGGKYKVALGEYRGTSGRLGRWVLPRVMLQDGTVVTIKSLWSDNASCKLEEDHNYFYPTELLKPFIDKKQLRKEIRNERLNDIKGHIG